MKSEGSFSIRKSIVKTICLCLAALVLFCAAGCAGEERNAAAVEIDAPAATEYVHPTRYAEPTPEPTEAAHADPATQAPLATPAAPPTLTSRSGFVYKYDSGLLRIDNAAFEPYGYVDDAARLYAKLVGETAQKLAGRATVYSLVIPASIGITVPDDLIPKIGESLYLDGCADMGGCIDRVYSYMPASVKTVNCFNRLMLHRDEYIYFRTDHHWTAYGAYMAYYQFMLKKGVMPYTLDSHEEVVFDNFLGTLYSSSGKDQNLLPADKIHAYYPVSPNVKMVVTYDEGITKEVPIVYDADKLKGANKYCTFAGGDNPITVFTNPAVTDGSVLIVLKESFANPLMAFLCDHYSKIIEIDYRHWTGGSIIDLAIRENATEILFANSIGVVSSKSFLGKLAVVLS